jgi:hypothetical protein
MDWFVDVFNDSAASIAGNLCETTPLRIHWFRRKETASGAGTQEIFTEIRKYFPGHGSRVMGHG